MKKMKIISKKDVIFFFVIILLIIAFNLWKVLYYNNSIYKTADDCEKTVSEYAEIVISCLDKGNAEGIKNCLSDKSIEYSIEDIDENIKEAISLLSGNVKNYEVRYSGISENAYRGGKPYYCYSSGSATITTKDNKNYSLSLDYIAVFKGEKDTEYTGVGCIALFDMDNPYSESSHQEILRIGYNDFEK